MEIKSTIINENHNKLHISVQNHITYFLLCNTYILVTLSKVKPNSHYVNLKIFKVIFN